MEKRLLLRSPQELLNLSEAIAMTEREMRLGLLLQIGKLLMLKPLGLQLLWLQQCSRGLSKKS